MAQDTSMGITLECQNLVDNIDKSAAKIEEFSKRAEKAIEKVEDSSVEMSETQKRVHNKIVDSYLKHASAIEKVKDEYEKLRQKMLSGQEVSQSEIARMKELQKEYKSHAGAIATNAKEMERMAKIYSTAGKSAKIGIDAFGALTSAVGGAGAIAIAKFNDFVLDTLHSIASLGLETQQTVSQFAAMANNLSDATATYQIFNDVARNTNYDFGAVNEMGKQLLNMGYSAQNAADLIQLCSDTAAGLGKGVEGAQQLVQTISRIQSTGEMSSKQLVNLQMAGLDMDKAFGSIGMTAEQAMKALDDGTLDSQKAIQALTNYMHEFDGSMDRSKQNIIDQWGDVTGNIATACGEIGAGIADAFMQSEVVKTLIDITQDLIDLVRSDGEGAFHDLKEVVIFVMSEINDNIKRAWTILKLGIVVVNSVYMAFKEMCANVIEVLEPVLKYVRALGNGVAAVMKAMGKGASGVVDIMWKESFTSSTKDKADKENHFKTAKRAGKTSGGSSSATAKLSEEEKQVEALVKKYADASKQAQERGKIALQIAGLNASMLVGEAKQREELQNKIDGFTANHEALVKGYEKELELASKISDATVRKDTIDAINAQAKAQDELYNKQVEAAKWQAEFGKMQESDKTLVDKFFGDPESTKAKIDTIKSNLTDFMTEINAMQASAGEEGMTSDSLSGLSSQSSDFLTKILKATPEELAAEYETKKGEFDNFAEFIKSKMAEASAAETQNLSIGEQWKQKQTEWIGSIGKSMGSAVADWIMGAKSIGQAMKEMVKNLISQAVQLLAQWTMVFALVSAFKGPKVGAEAANKMVLGIGDWKGFATGGFVAGPGTSTSDSIPAMLSDGEYVLNASAVRAVGVGNLDALNYGRTPNYSSSGAGNIDGAGGRSLSVSINTLDPSSFTDFLGRGGLNSIKQALFEDDRQFGSTVGVW